LARRGFDRGEIELIRTGFEPPPVAIHAVWPATRVLSAGMQLFIAFLAAQLKLQCLQRDSSRFRPPELRLGDALLNGAQPGAFGV